MDKTPNEITAVYKTKAHFHKAYTRAGQVNTAYLVPPVSNLTWPYIRQIITGEKRLLGPKPIGKELGLIPLYES